MNIQKLGTILIAGCVLALAGAIVFRLMNMGPFFVQPVRGLWKLSLALSLMAIAIGVNTNRLR